VTDVENKEQHVAAVCVRSLKLWTATDGTQMQTIGHSGRISCVAFSRDSLYVVTGSEDMSLKVWEAATGKLTQVGLTPPVASRRTEGPQRTLAAFGH